MRIMLFSGSWPPAPCGVGHYTNVLADHLSGSAEIIRYGRDPDFRFVALWRILADIRRLRPDVIHIQYPTLGYRRSIVPSLISILFSIPTVVTLHEYSIFRWYRAPWFLPFRFSNTLIFTSAFELKAFERLFGRRRRKTCVIPIGSNIPLGIMRPRSPETVCYFGLLMPQKGIEDFLHFVLLAKGLGLKPLLIGAIPAGFEVYASEVVEQCRMNNIRVYLGKSDREVADLLRTTSYAYLPFPDGASEKRGSLLAALLNEVLVLTPHSITTPNWMRATTIDAASPQSALTSLIKLKTLERGGLRAVDFTEVSRMIDWKQISEEHLRIYRATIAKTADRL